MCTWVSSGPAYLMIPSMSPPWWKVCGAQYRNETQSASMPRTRSTPARPSSTKSSGCGSSTSRMPSRTKTGASSSSDRQNWASLAAAASGRPLNSEFITVTPRSTVIWMARFQLRTAAWRSSSSGPDHRYSGSTEAISTPAAVRALLKPAIWAWFARGCRKNGRKSSRGDSSM